MLRNLPFVLNFVGKKYCLDNADKSVQFVRFKLTTSSSRNSENLNLKLWWNSKSGKCAIFYHHWRFFSWSFNGDITERRPFIVGLVMTEHLHTSYFTNLTPNSCFVTNVPSTKDFEPLNQVTFFNSIIWNRWQFCDLRNFRWSVSRIVDYSPCPVTSILGTSYILS